MPSEKEILDLIENKNLGSVNSIDKKSCLYVKQLFYVSKKI